MSSRKPGVALLLSALVLFLGLASEGWAQQLVSGGNFSDRTAHNQFFHTGDTIQVQDVFYSCVGADLVTSPLAYDIPTALGVRYVISGHGNPTSTWDTSGGAPNSLNGSPTYTDNQHISIPITPFAGPAYRFFLGNIWMTASGSPSSGNLTGTNRTDVGSITVADFPTGTIPTTTIFPGTTVAAGNIVITETSTPGGAGIWVFDGTNYGLRIRIPTGIGVKWNTAVTTIGNGGNSHVSTTVTYIGTQTVQINVTTQFSASESVTLSGLQFVVDPTAVDTEFKLDVMEGQLTNNTVHCVVNQSTTGIFIRGVPTIDSAANQVFTVGDASKVIGDITLKDSQGTTKIPSGTVLSLIIPASLNLEWDSAFAPTFTTTMTIGPVNFVADGLGRIKTMTISVTTNSGSGNTLVVKTAHFKNFSNPNAAGVALQMQYDVAQPLITDSKTNAIGQPTISSLDDQVFVVNQGIANLHTITVKDDATNQRIKNGVPFEIEIPAALKIVFTGTNPTLSGNLNGAVSFNTPATGGFKRIRITPTLNFTALTTGTIDNLEINASNPNSIGSMKLYMDITSVQSTFTDGKILVIGSFPSMASTATQQFTVNDPSTQVFDVTITTDAGSAPLFQNGDSLQLIIPDTFFAEWNTSPSTFSLSGSASAKVNAGGITYPLDINGKRKILQLPITVDWTTGDVLTFVKTEMTNFTATCSGAGTSLLLKVQVGGAIAATDTNAKSIGRPIITSTGAVQAFGQGDPSTLASKITIKDDPVTPRILGGTEVRIRIPNGFSMFWDNTVVPTPVTTVAGTGTLGTFGTAAQYYYTNPQGDRVLRIPVSSNFSANQTFEISNVRFNNFTIHAASNLELEVNNKEGIANAFDTTHSIVVGTRPLISSVTTMDLDNNGSIDHLIVTVDRPLDVSSPSIGTGAGFTAVGYPIVSGNLDLTHQILTYTILESGLPDTGINPVVSYDATAGSLLESANKLSLNSTIPTVADKAPPIIVNFTTTDADGNGHLDKMTFTFSENLAGTPDISQWTLIDADGTTKLLAGLTNSAFSIQNGNQLVITFSNTIGTAGTPRYQFIKNGVPGSLEDGALNLIASTTNNHPPIVNPGQPQSLFPTVVTLDGSLSHDPDGQPLSYAWSFVGFVPAPGPVPPPPVPTLVNGNTAVCTTLLTTAGVYTFKLTVSDGLASTNANVSITILNVPPTAHAGPDQGCPTGGFYIALDGRLSTDANGLQDIQSYVWNLISGPPGATPLVNGVQNPAGFDGFHYVPNLTGTYEFELTVTDRAGNISKDRCFARANPVGVPTAVAGPTQIVKTNTPVTLDASSSISAGGLLTYLWTSTNNPADPVGPLDAGTNITKLATFTPNGPGIYTFTLVVSNGVVASIPSPISILVYDPANLPPNAVANRLTPVGNATVGSSVLLDSTGSSDPEGAALKYAWIQSRGPLVTLSNSTVARPTFIPPVTGYYEFLLTVNDGVQSSLPAKVGFNVVANASSTIPAGTVSGTTPHIVGTPVALTPSFTVAPVYYEWTQTGGPSIGSFTWNISWGGPTTTFNFTPAPTLPGVYTFDLSVWDAAQVLVVIPVSVTVNSSAASVVPTAKAAASSTQVMAGQIVTLDGSGSTDEFPAVPLPAPPAARYLWSQISGPPVSLSDATAVMPTFVVPSAGVYVFSLKVNDGTSDSAADFVVVTAQASDTVAVGGGNGGGGCGLGAELMLILPGLWVAAWFRRRSVK